MDDALDHVFGVVLLNDWSARDLQAWESRPLGPLLGRSFATSISAWVTPLDALAAAWVDPPPRDPPPMLYLLDGDEVTITATAPAVGGCRWARSGAGWCRPADVARFPEPLPGLPCQRYSEPMSADPVVDLRWRFTVEEYERMGEVGIFGEDDRVELLDGEIVTMSPIGPKHAGVVNRMTRRLVQRLGDLAVVIVQNPLRLLPRSEPQPDFIVARERRDFYQSGHPTAEDVYLVIEVADSSLRTDRAIKIPIYARQGVAEVWIVDLAGNEVLIYADPVDGAYRDVRKARRGDDLTPRALPDLTLAVADILGD